MKIVQWSYLIILDGQSSTQTQVLIYKTAVRNWIVKTWIISGREGNTRQPSEPDIELAEYVCPSLHIYFLILNNCTLKKTCSTVHCMCSADERLCLLTLRLKCTYALGHDTVKITSGRHQRERVLQVSPEDGLVRWTRYDSRTADIVRVCRYRSSF